MQLNHWLTTIRERLRCPASDRKPAPSPVRPRRWSQSIELLEQRTLLTVQVVQIDNELLITSDASDTIAVQAATGSPALVEVVGNGTVVPGLPDIDASTVTKITIIGDDGDNTIDLTAVTASVFSSNVLELIVEAGDGDDTILGSLDLPTTVQGDDGDDTITGGNAADVLDGGDGRDIINAGLGDDTVNGDDGADVINGESGNDVINGGASADTIDGGVGDDILNGDTGNDSITGDVGDDTINGGSNDDLLFGQDGDDSIVGGGGNDLLEGDIGTDTLEGQDGRDTLLGQADNDSLDGGRGADSVDGNDGDDTANGGLGNDTVTGGDGDDTLFGGGGNDLMVGDGPGAIGDDRMSGNAGNDTLLGGLGADFINGGRGDDLIDTRSNAFTVNDVQVLEGQTGETTRAVFTVTLSAVPTAPVTVDYTITGDGTPAGGTALLGTDFTAPMVSDTLTFLPGQTSLDVPFDVIGDLGNESDETVLITLSNPVGATIADGQGEGLILDDDVTTPVDVFLVLDDTGSFQNVGSSIFSIFTTIITTLQTRLAGVELAFGVGRFETYSTFAGRPYVLNQPIISTTEPQFQAAIDAALMRQLPGGGSNAEPAFEALRQIATGAGFDGNGNGNTTDAGAAGPFANQVATGAAVGPEIAAYTTFTPDLTGDPNGPIISPTNPDLTMDGVGFQAGRRHIVLLATDSPGLVHEDDGLPVYTGIGGVTVPGSVYAPDAIITPNGAGAQIQSTINELLADNIEVIGLGQQNFFFGNLQTQLEGIATLTGAINRSGVPVENNITPGPSPDDIQPGDPLYFEVDENDPQGLADSIADGITAVLPPPPPPPVPVSPTFFAQNDTLNGNDGNDTILAGGGDDLIDGAVGDDSLEGGGGMDTLISGEGDDTIDGGFGDDDVTGEEGDNTLGGGNGNDTITIEPFADGGNVSTETSGADTVIIRGTDEANTFRVSQNSDDLMVVTTSTASIVISKSVRTVIIEGMAGDDTVTLGDGTITPLLSGDIDRIQPLALSIRLGDGNDTFDGRGGRLGLVPIEVLGGDGQDTITGSAGRDLIDGGGDADVIDGARGNDSIVGGPGNDTIVGGRDDDTLIGGDGDDNLNGNIGDDVIRGGLGNDFLNGQAGGDTIEGEIGDDTVFAGSGPDLVTGGPGADLLKGNSGNDTIFGMGGDDTIIGNNGDDVINGGDGDDSIRSGTGNDLITGADGADFVNAQAGNDSVLGGDGNDTLFGGGGQDVVLGGDGDDIVRGNGSSRDTVAGNEGDEDDLDDNRPGEINEAFTLSAQLLSALDEPI